MAKPDVRVRIAFSDGPYVASPTWTTVTTYVRSVNISRGRTDDWNNFDSGSATLVLDNRDRRFDPTYSAGPYYGNLLPRRQVLIDATTNGSTYYEIFRGFIDGWPVNLTQAGYDSTVTVNCYDVLGLISQQQLPVDWSHNYITSLTPKHYWRLDDTINPANIPQTAGTLGNLTFTDAGSTNYPLQLATAATPVANASTLAPGLAGTSINSSAGLVSSSAAAYEIITSVTTSLWFSPGATPYGYIYSDANDYAGLGVSFHEITYSQSNARFEVYVGEPATYPSQKTLRVYYFPMNLNMAIPHHVALTYTGNTINSLTNLALYVDGQSITNTSNTTFLGPPGYREGTVAYRVSGNCQQVAVFFSILTATQIQTIYQLGNNVLTETTAARMSRIVGQTSIPGAFYATPASPAGTVAELTTGGAFVGNELQLTADSEGGELYTSRSGVLTMTNRTYFESGNSKTNQATFGVGGIPIGTEMSYSWSADNIRNTLDIGWTGGANYTATDTASVAAYGTMQTSWQTALSTLADVQSLSYYLVGFGKLPRLVMSAIEVGQALSTANWNTVLQLELLDRITVVVDEPVGSDLSQTQLIQQVEHEITPGDWKTRILGSARWSSYFILDTSTLDGTDLLG